LDDSIKQALLDPPELSPGTAYRLNVYHIMQVDELAPLFPVEIEDL
jgi:hypothetical protein